MADDENVPFLFQADRREKNPPRCTNVSQDKLWWYMHAKTESLHQAHRGKTFNEEDNVRNVHWYCWDDYCMCIVRYLCLPSMKKAPYTASFTRDTCTIMRGISSCVAG